MANINAQFNYSANFGPVIGQMQKLTTEANLLNNTLQNLDKQAVGLKTSLATSFASDLGKIGGWNAKMVELTDSVDQFGQSLLKQKLTLREYAKEAIGAFTKSSNAHKLAVREVAREMSQLVTLGKGMDGKQMGMMITPATINLKDFNTQMAVSQKQWSIFNSLVQDGTTHLINFGKNTQWAGRQITVGLTVPLTIYGNAVSKIFREVDAELTRFQKVYGSELGSTSQAVTERMVSDVRNIAIEFSRSFGIAAKETAALAADLAATGLEGQKLLASLRETTRLAVLGDVSNQDAMKTTLSLQNAFKMSTDELAESVNFLNAVENQTSLSLQDLTTAIPKAGPVIKSLGGDVKDLSLLMVALKEGGISAAEGANALKSGMASLINPTKQASLTAKQYGIDIEGIVQANRGQLMPTIMAFQQQLQLLDDFGKAQVIENVFGKYQFARLSALFDNLNASASQTNAVIGLMGKSNRELAATAYQEMDTLMNSASKRFQRAVEGIKSQFLTVGESITTSIVPILESVTRKIGQAIEFFQNLPKPIKSFIKVAVGLTAVAGPIIMMVGIFSNFLGYIGKGAMGMVNLGRRMAGLPTQKFEMLTDTQIMAQKATDQLANSFNTERSSVERLNQALAIYRQNLIEAIKLNPAFVNRQMPTPKPITSGLDIPVAQPTTKLQSGGKAWVPGSGNGDKVPAMLEPGEYVVNKKAAAQNSALLDDINFRQAPRFQMGGRMPGYASKSFPGVPTVDVNPYKLIGMGGVNEDNPIAGLDRQSGMFYKQISNNRGLNTNAMIAEAVFSQLYRSGLFGSNVTGIDQRLYNANTGNKTMPVLGSTFIKGLKTGDKLFDNKSRQINRPTPFAKGVVNKKAIEAMLAAQILGNADTHSGNFGLSGGKIAMLDNTANLFTDATGNQRRTSKALNDFSYSPDTAGLDRAGTQAYGKLGSKKADSHVIGYLNSVLGNLNSGNYIAQSINLATQGSPELLKNINAYAVKKSGGASKTYEQLLTSMISMRTQKLMQEFYLDADNMTLVDEDTRKMRLQSNAEESYRQPFQKTDKEYETVYKWISGELDYFRRRKNVKGRWTDSEKFDAERYQELLSVMRSVPEGTKMMRGSILNPGMSGEMSKEAQLAMLTAIQTGDYGSLYGMDISFNDFASFASDAMGPEYGPRGMKGGVSRFSASAYRKLYRGVHSRDTESGRFFDNIERQRATGKESKYGSSPVMYDFTAGPNTQGRDISMGDPSTGAPYPKYRDSWVKEVPDEINEILTYRPQGTITGVSSDLATRQPIIHVQGKQSGGRINGYANSSTVFAHSVPPQAKNGISLHYPIGFNISKNINDALNQQKATVKKQDLISAINKPGSTSHMSGFFSSFAKKNPKSGINAATANIVKSETLQTLKDAPPLLNDPMFYNESLQSKQISGMYNTFKSAGFLSDFRANISEESLLSKGFKYDNNGNLVSPDKSISMQKVKTAYGYKWVEAKTGSTLGRSVYTGRQRSFTSNPLYDYLLGNKAAKKQSGGRINGYAAETASWAKKAAAPKAYAGVLQGIPNWATKPAEYEAIVNALRAAGIPESDRLASYYIQDVLAHINPSTTNANGVYEKVWAAANLMKDSQVYNVFLETLNSRKDIGGLLNPSTVSRVAAASGLPVSVVQAELTKMADGVHPNTANGARVMMTLARLFPSKTSPGMPIAVAAGLGARLQGNFYDTLGQRALPSNLPNVTVRSYDPKGTAAPTSSGQGSKVSSSGLIMPSGAIRPSIIMPNIQSISSAAGGTGTSATVKVDGMGNVLSNGIDDMVANTVTGQPIAVSSKELLAIAPGGGIAGVTSPGDEARGNIVHPMGTALIRGKNFQQKRLKGFAATSAISGLDFVEANTKTPTNKVQQTQPVYDQPISGGSMGQFGGNAFMMISVMQQMSFAMNQFTSDAQNGGSKFVAAMNLALTATQMMGSGVGDTMQQMAKSREAAFSDIASKKTFDARGKEVTKMSSGIGKVMGGLGKGMSMLGSLPVQMGLQAAIMVVNKGIEIYQREMAKAREAGRGAFKEPLETAKLLGIELKSLTADTERYAKFAETLFGSQGRGAYDKVFAETVKKDYGDFLDILAKTETKQEQINQLTNAYGNLIQRGMDPKVALELTAEIARQGKAMTAFNEAQGNFTLKDTVGDVMKMQTDSLDSQIEILNQRSADFGMMGSFNVPFTAGSRAQNASNDRVMFETLGATGEGVFDKTLRGIFGTQGAGKFGAGAALTKLIAPMLLDSKTKEQIAAQIGATLRGAFAIAAQDPVASNEAMDAIVANFKNADTGKVAEEVGKIADEFGFGDLTNIGLFIDSGSFENLSTEDMSKEAQKKGEETQRLFLNALKSGLGPELDKMLADGDLSPEEEAALKQKTLEAMAIMKIDVEIDLQLDETSKQLEAVQEELNKLFDIALRGKQEELDAEDKRHEKAMKNLDNESQRLNDKKELLQRNTDYYLKELEREKQAEDYYANQRDTALQGLSAISQGDVFGFIGAQMKAASSADQFGRDRSLASIQETADAAQQKLDDELKAIDLRKQAESERHAAEVANINSEIELLNKKKSAASSDLQEAVKLLKEAMALQPSKDPKDQKIYNEKVAQAMQLAGGAIDTAKAAAGFVDKTGLSPDLQKEMDDAQKKTGEALNNFYKDTDTAMQYIANGGENGWEIVLTGMSDASKEIFNDVAKSLNIDANSKEFVGAANFLARAINSGTTVTINSNRVSVDSPTVREQASGGYISGPGSATSDSIPAMLSNGEYVINASAVKAYGPKFMDKINTKKFAVGGIVGSMPAMSSAPGFAGGGSVPMPKISAPSTPTYNVPSAGGGMSPAPIAQMARGGMMSGSASDNSSSYNFNFNGAGMDMVMSHVNKAVGGRINSNSRRIG